MWARQGAEVKVEFFVFWWVLFDLRSCDCSNLVTLNDQPVCCAPHAAVFHPIGPSRVDASRYDLSSGLPSLDMWFSYCYAQEGEFRSKFEVRQLRHQYDSSFVAGHRAMCGEKSIGEEHPLSHPTLHVLVVLTAHL